MGLSDLPTLGAERAQPKACPKDGLPTPIARKERKLTKEQKAKAFRDAVWDRDKGRCRATGKKLIRGDGKHGETDWTKLGEVDHAYPRSTAPERIYDVENGLLLTKELNRLRKVACIEAPEYRVFSYDGPDNRGEKQHFVWRDHKTGRITKERVG